MAPLRRTLPPLALVIALVGAGGCEQILGGGDSPTPRLLEATPGRAPGNVLSARVSFRVDGADSVRVVYQSAADAAGATPWFPAGVGKNEVTVLGLRPTTRYQLRVEAAGGGVVRTSEPASVQTAALPASLARVRLHRLAGTGTRMALTGVRSGDHSYAVAFGPAGEIVWYRDFESTEDPVSDVRRQPNGNFTAFVGSSQGWQAWPGRYEEFTAEGESVRSWRAPSGYYLDGHEIQVTGAGAATRAHLFTYDTRIADLSGIGGPARANLATHQVVRLTPGGNPEWSWDASGRLDLDEWLGDEDLKRRVDTDFDHPNSLTFDPSGNYVISWRNLDQVMVVDPRSGDVVWRVGGRRGEYTFVGDPQGGFRKQHSAHVLENGNLLLFDNGSDRDEPESRAVEYRIDHQARTATMVWEYRHSPAIYTPFTGYVERLPGGNSWVAFAFTGRVVEVDPAGAVVWEGQVTIDGGDAVLYRVVPLESLYAPR